MNFVIKYTSVHLIICLFFYLYCFISENIDYFYGDCMASWLGVRMTSRNHFEFPGLAGPEAFPFVFKDVGTRPPLLEIKKLAGVALRRSYQFPFYTQTLWNLDDLLPAFIVETDRPIVDPIGPMFGENLPLFNAVLVFRIFDQLPGIADNLALPGLQFCPYGVYHPLRVMDGKIDKFNR